MSIADSLFREAQAIAAHFQGTASNLEREILDLETQLQKKKAALHAAAWQARERATFARCSGRTSTVPVAGLKKKRTLPSGEFPGTR